MKRNLKTLDSFDKDSNIYELICELSEKAHLLLGGAISSGRTGIEDDVVEMVMESKLAPPPEDTESGEQETVSE